MIRSLDNKKIEKTSQMIIYRKIILLFIFIVLCIAGYFYFRFSQFYSKVSTNDKIWDIIPKKEKNAFSFLLLGYGGPGHEGLYLTDTMMVFRVDTETKKALLISIPRDMWVKVPTNDGEDFYSKINAVYQMGLFGNKYKNLKNEYKSEQGAGELVKSIVSSAVGFPIDYYVAVDFAGFVTAIDELGGVDIYIDRAFTDPKYPIEGKEEDVCEASEEELEELLNIATESPELAFPCRYETLHFDKGTIYMDGALALKYVRSRHALEDGGDFGRARRQQRFLEAVREKVVTIGFIPKILPLMEGLQDHIRTDVPLDVSKKFIDESADESKYNLSQLVLTTDNYLKVSYSADGQFILIPKEGIGKWNNLKQNIQNMILEITPTLSPTIKE